LSTTIAPDSGVTSYSYDAVGNRASVTYPNGTTAAYTYDSLNRLTLLENRKSGGELISSYYYTLGPAGNRLSVVEQSGRTVNYTYDTLYRLTQEAITDPALGNEIISYTYDDFGNRLTKTDASGTISYTYDANDRMLSEAGPTSIATYTYDDNGNTLSKTEGVDTTFYSYDFENRLVGVNSAAGATAYGYDSDGIRVAKVVGGNITNYLVDHNRPYAQVLEETDNGSLTVSYVYGDDLISQNRGSSYYYLYDGQMSTRQLTNETETVANTYTYDAFGVLIDQAGAVGNNYMYTGEQYDPNAGFYYLRARYYNQGIGRFATVDPFDGFDVNPTTLHKYLYANTNPVMFADPSGHIGVLTVFLNNPVTRRILVKLGVSSVLTATTLGMIAHEAIVRDIDLKHYPPGAKKLSLKGAGPNAGWGFVDVHVPPNFFYEIKVSGTSGDKQIFRYGKYLTRGTNNMIDSTIPDVPVYINNFPVLRLAGIEVKYNYVKPGLIWYKVGLTKYGLVAAKMATMMPMMYSMMNSYRLKDQTAMAVMIAGMGGPL